MSIKNKSKEMDCTPENLVKVTQKTNMAALDSSLEEIKDVLEGIETFVASADRMGKRSSAITNAVLALRATVLPSQRATKPHHPTQIPCGKLIKFKR